MDEKNYAFERVKMVEKQIVARGIRSPSLLQAFKEVPRHLFISEDKRIEAYTDHPLPIEEQQTISQPYIVALMLDVAQLNKKSRVLEIGTGSGYSSAITSCLVNHLFTVERFESLAVAASQKLKEQGYHNISIKTGDGSLGWKEYAPFDAIIVTAASPSLPPSLYEQLAVGGRLVIPIGDQFLQTLFLITKTTETTYSQQSIEGVRFVPLIGEEGW